MFTKRCIFSAECTALSRFVNKQKKPFLTFRFFNRNKFWMDPIERRAIIFQNLIADCTAPFTVAIVTDAIAGGVAPAAILPGRGVCLEYQQLPCS